MTRMLACLMGVGLATASFAVDAPDRCTFGGKFHAAGTIVCNHGKQQQCSGGAWKPLGTSCAHGTAHVVPGVRTPNVKHPNAPQQPSEPHQPAAHQPPTA